MIRKRLRCWIKSKKQEKCMQFKCPAGCKYSLETTTLDDLIRVFSPGPTCPYQTRLNDCLHYMNFFNLSSCEENSQK